MKERAFVIGDIHGEYQMLKQLLTYWSPEEEELIFVGDLIDRGPQIFKTLELVWSLQKEYDAKVIRGNHEALFLDFLQHPNQAWDLYQRNGGATTLASLNHLALNEINDYPLDELVNLTTENYPYLMAWLENLPLYLEYGEWIIVHAGVDLQLTNWQQSKPSDFYWIRDPFHLGDNRTGKKIIFGHTPVKFLNATPGDLSTWHHQGKFGIDGGAVYGGDLIGIHITQSGELLKEDHVTHH